MPFNFDQVARDLDGEKEDVSQDGLLAVVNGVCEWLYPKGARKSTMLLRAFVFVWLMRPEWLGNPTQVAMAERLGMSKARFGKAVNQFRDEFGFYVAGMRGEAARGKFSAAARAGAGRLAEARRKANQRKTLEHSTAATNSAQGCS